MPDHLMPCWNVHPYATAAQLRAALDGVPDNTPVVILANGCGWLRSAYEQASDVISGPWGTDPEFETTESRFVLEADDGAGNPVDDSKLPTADDVRGILAFTEEDTCTTRSPTSPSPGAEAPCNLNRSDPHDHA